jgi:hypothetical protein
LLEAGRVDSGLGENLNVEGPGEVAALIPKWSWSEDNEVLDSSSDDLHGEQHSEFARSSGGRPKPRECFAILFVERILGDNDLGKPTGRGIAGRVIGRDVRGQ